MPMDRGPVTPAERLAVGIPVVIADSDLTEGRTSFVATDNRRRRARRGGPGRDDGRQGSVILLRYQEGSASTFEREEGFLAAVGKAAGIEVISSNQYAGATNEGAYQASENLLNSFKEVDGIFCPNESAAFGMLRALQDSGRADDVAFVGFDASEKLVEALRAGEIDALVLQDPVRMGELSVRACVAAARGEAVEPRIDTGVVVVPSSSIDDPSSRLSSSPTSRSSRRMESAPSSAASAAAAPDQGSHRAGGVHALRWTCRRTWVRHALLGRTARARAPLQDVAGAQAPTRDLYRRRAIRPHPPRGPGARRRDDLPELNLCPHLSVLENVTLGREASRLGVKRLDAARGRLEQVLRDLDVSSFTGDTLVSELGPGDRQLVEIARALCLDATIIVFDEPTSSLSAPDVDRLFRVTRRLVEAGVTVLWISHFLDEVKAIGNRFTVLRDGETVGQGEVPETSTDEMVTTMAGRSMAEAYRRSPRTPGEVALSVGLGASGPREASFELRSGEILGVFGLVGAGRTESLRSLYGLDPSDRGSARSCAGKGLSPPPSLLVELGVGLLSEDRARGGRRPGPLHRGEHHPLQRSEPRAPER